MKNLYVFDMDWTLFETDVKIAVYHNGEFEKHLWSSKQYNEHLKQKTDAHYYDFSEYTSARVFKEQAKPITHIIDIAKSAIEDEHSDVILLTARNSPDDIELFKEVFDHHGLDSTKIHFNFAGDLRDLHGRDTLSAPEAKRTIVDSYMWDEQYSKVYAYDDLKENLDAILSLVYYYPEVSFKAYHVKALESTTIVKEI